MKWLNRMFRKKNALDERIIIQDKESGKESVIHISTDVESWTRQEQAHIHNEKGVDYFENREFDKAIVEYQKAIDIWPNELHYMNLGNALISKGAAEHDRNKSHHGSNRQGRKTRDTLTDGATQAQYTTNTHQHRANRMR